MGHADIAALLDGIRAMPDDPVGRNRQITLCYRDLALGLADVMSRRDLNWFVFGAWASGTAGRTIRGEGLPFDAGTSTNVAAGNLAIILDVAPPFVRWLEEIERDGGPTRAALDRTLADPLLQSAPSLAAAITAYHAAIELAASPQRDDPETDRDVAELVLLGNVLVGAHEQALVDRFIDSAMPLGGVFGLVTTRFIHIVTADGPIDVACDVPLPSYLAGAQFPPTLVSLRHPDLVAAAARFGQTTGVDVASSNAWSWESFDERMGFIFTFFRAYQRDGRHFDVPVEFLPAQAVTITPRGLRAPPRSQT